MFRNSRGRRYSYSSIHIDGIHPLVYLALIFIILTIFIIGNTVTRRVDIIVDSKYWVSTTHATETHQEQRGELVETCRGFGENKRCTDSYETYWISVTNTVCKHHKRGNTLPVIYPDISQSCIERSDDIDKSVYYNIRYTYEESDDQKIYDSRANLDVWKVVENKQYYKIRKTLFGKLVRFDTGE